jgi:hypothetical protein
VIDLVLQTPDCAQIFNIKFYVNIYSLCIIGETEMPPVDRIISRTNIEPYYILKIFPSYQF